MDFSTAVKMTMNIRKLILYRIGQVIKICTCIVLV